MLAEQASTLITDSFHDSRPCWSKVVLSFLLRQPRPPSPVPTGSLQAGNRRHVIFQIVSVSLGTLNWLAFNLYSPIPHPHQTAPNLLQKKKKNGSLADCNVGKRVATPAGFCSLAPRPQDSQGSARFYTDLKGSGALFSFSSNTELLQGNRPWTIRTSAHVDSWSREVASSMSSSLQLPLPFNAAARPLHSLHLILSIFFRICQSQTIELVSYPYSCYSPFLDYQGGSPLGVNRPFLLLLGIISFSLLLQIRPPPCLPEDLWYTISPRVLSSKGWAKVIDRGRGG